MSITGYSDEDRDRGCWWRVAPFERPLGPAERPHRFDPSYSSNRCICGRAKRDPVHTEENR